MLSRKWLLFLSGMLLAFVFLSQSCRKDIFYNDDNAQLKFSEDTVHFDTVFTTVGSITLPLKVFNSYDNPVLISTIQLAGGEASQFRLNVDGEPGTVFHDIEIPANDSIYLFIEVTVDPNSDVTPYVIEDSILFETNGNLQDVNLVSWGQNAHFHNAEILCDTTWTNNLPHVIYNYVFVDTGCTLTIEQGCRIFVHGSSSVIAQGNIKVNGTKDSLVSFQGDRLEDFFGDVPGQWNGIYLLRGSVDNDITYAKIFNAIDGISLGGRVDDEFTPDDISYFLIDQPELDISNSYIYDCQNNGIFSLNSKIAATNVLIYNVGLSNAALFLGGDYNFTHCTLANYSSAYLDHQTPVLGILDLYAFSTELIASSPVTKGDFINCIIYGSLPEGNEIVIDSSGAAEEFTYIFDHCVLKTDILPDELNDTECIFADPEFASIGERNYCPAQTSPALNAGISTGITIDIRGELRPAPVGSAPDIGCYEIPGE